MNVGGFCDEDCTDEEFKTNCFDPTNVMAAIVPFGTKVPCVSSAIETYTTASGQEKKNEKKMMRNDPAHRQETFAWKKDVYWSQTQTFYSLGIP